MTSALLPNGFAELESLLPDWALPTHNERWAKRRNSTEAELANLYSTVLSRLEDILDHCDQFALGELPEDSGRLFELALMIAEVAPQIELFHGSVTVPYAFDETRMDAVHGNERH